MFGFLRLRLAIYGFAALLVWHATGQAPQLLSSVVDRANNAIVSLMPGQSEPISTAPLGTWRTCNPIPVYVNAGSQAELDLTVHAIAVAAHTSGARLVYAGTTNATPTTHWVTKKAPKGSITITWTTPGRTDLITPSRVGGAQVKTNSRGDITAAGIAINSDQNTRYDLTFGSGRTMGNALLHEIGHALGAPHTSIGSLMYKTIDASAPDGYTDQDQAALRSTVNQC